MDDDEEDESWNLAAPRMEVNRRGPTISTHDGKEWVHIEDYKRAKRTLNEYVKQREWDNENIKELHAQVSELRERHKFSTAERGRNSLSERRKYFTPEDHVNEANISEKSQGVVRKQSPST